VCDEAIAGFARWTSRCPGDGLRAQPLDGQGGQLSKVDVTGDPAARGMSPCYATERRKGTEWVPTSADPTGRYLSEYH
jgi:hypothetical protein